MKRLHAHAARIAVLKLLRKSDSADVLSQKIKDCIRIQSQLGEIQSSIGITERLIVSVHIPPWEVFGCIIDGLAQADPKYIDSGIVKNVSSLLEGPLIDSLTAESITNLTRILSYSGIPENLRYLVPYMKEKCTDKVRLIGALRTLKSEANFAWETFTHISPPDANLLVDFVSVIVAANGWHERVPILLKRIGNTPLNPKVCARLIRAFSHKPLGTETVEHLIKIVSLTRGGIDNIEVKEALMEFYLVNEQWTSVLALIQKEAPSIRSLSDDIVALIMGSVNADVFFDFFSVLRFRLKSKALNRAIEISVRHKSTKQLFEVLEIVYRKKIEVDPVQFARITELTRNPDVPSRVRKRLGSIVEMIEQIQAEEVDFRFQTIT